MSDPSKAVRKWADVAMYESEKVRGTASDAPVVHLLNQTADPLGSIASMWLMYKGQVVRNLSEVTDQQRSDALKDGLDNRLNTPLEAVQFHFMIEGLHRGITHQQVRQRVGAAFAQESMRFAVKDDLATQVYLAPSLHGIEGPVDEQGHMIWDPAWSNDLWSKHDAPDNDRDFEGLTDGEKMRVIWDTTVEHINEAYQKLISMGMPAEEARGLIPTNVKTRIHYVTNLRALREHAGNRLCTQAQWEWRLIFSGIIKAIRDWDTDAKYPTGHGPVGGGGYSWADQRWQQQELTQGQAFRPACFQVGHCPFEGMFDRHCNIRDRVRMNAQAGSPPSEWEEDHKVSTNGNGPTWIPAIRPEEWLADGAARRSS